MMNTVVGVACGISAGSLQRALSNKKRAGNLNLFFLDFGFCLPWSSRESCPDARHCRLTRRMVHKGETRADQSMRAVEQKNPKKIRQLLRATVGVVGGAMRHDHEYLESDCCIQVDLHVFFCKKTQVRESLKSWCILAPFVSSV
jgi:hypothetical protein